MDAPFETEERERKRIITQNNNNGKYYEIQANYEGILRTYAKINS